MKRLFYSDLIAITSSVINNADEKAQKHLEPEFKDFLANFYTEALAGTLVDWVREKHIRDKEKTILYLKIIIQTSLNHFNL